ncbi:MAG: OmpA family protein [Paracoccus sp.]|nr:OmpA family protein [Paracoccus sp. (in: a-proteobacteria)]
MRRIFQNSTAIAACLSLLAPHMALAQTVADADAPIVAPSGETAPQAADSASEAPTLDAAPVEADAAAEASPDATVLPAETEVMAPDMDVAPEASVEATSEAEAPATDSEAALDEAMAAEQDNAEGETTGTTGAAPLDAAPVEAGTAAEASPDATALPAEAEVTAPAMEVAPEASVEATSEAEASTSTEGDAVSSETTATSPLEAEASTPPAPEADATEPTTQGDTTTQSDDAPTAAALDDSATAEVTEEQVTEENSRSSSEDFATALQQATSTDGNQEQSGDNDDDNDLAKAILLGLGGVAVGAMLSNNRQVALSTPDRIVVTRSDGTQQLIKDDVALLRQPGSTVATENFDDGSSRTIVTRSDGSRIVTIRDADLQILRRTLISADGEQTMLLDDTSVVEPVDVASLPAPAQTFDGSAADLDETALREALMARLAVDRRFSLSQIRDISEVRSLVTSVDVNAVTFQTDSAAIDADQARKLTALGNVIREAIAGNPNEIFLVEGHTDTVGDPAANLALSDRRAESVALALSEYFQVPPENMVIQGYGEQLPRIQQEGDVRENRRASVRRITDLLQTASN